MKTVLVDICLAAANGGASSIAMPALGTGKLGWPARVVANLMFEAIGTFDSAKGANGRLDDIRIVVYHNDHATCQVCSTLFLLILLLLPLPLDMFFGEKLLHFRE